MYLPAVTLLALANFDVRDLEKIWRKNSEELKAVYALSSSKRNRHRKVTKTNKPNKSIISVMIPTIVIFNTNDNHVLIISSTLGQTSRRWGRQFRRGIRRIDWIVARK